MATLTTLFTAKGDTNGQQLNEKMGMNDIPPLRIATTEEAKTQSKLIHFAELFVLYYGSYPTL